MYTLGQRQRLVSYRLVLMVALLLLLLGVAAWWYSTGYQLLRVQTGSMVPTFTPGDMLLIKPVLPANLQRGDIVSYHSLQHPGMIISHRVVSLRARGHRLTTKGDRLRVADPPVDSSQVIGRAVGVAPGLGRPVGWLTSSRGVLLAVDLPAIAVAGYEVRRLLQNTAPAYRAAR